MNTDAVLQLPQYLRLLLLLDSCAMLESRKYSGLLGTKSITYNSKCRLPNFIGLFKSDITQMLNLEIPV
jgi:hypothetical protein